MTVKDLMMHEVVTIDPGALIFDAVLKMHKHHVRHLPVVDLGRLVGILSNRDIRFLATEITEESRQQGNYSLSLNNKVYEVMITDPVITSEDVPLAEIVDVFLEEKVGAIPVVDDQDHLVGMIGYIDLLKVLRDRL